MDRFGLPSLIKLEGGKGGRYWKQGAAGLSAKINGVLAVIGGIIGDPPSSRQPSQGSAHPFDSPWGTVTRVTDFDGSSTSTTVPTCMLLDREKLQSGMIMNPRRGEKPSRKYKNKWQHRPPPNYVRLHLGSSKGTAIYEYCHRFVCAVINGPPDEAAGLVDVVHICRRPGDPSRFGNPACIHPLHLVFGRPDDNRLTGAKAQERFRVLLQLASSRRSS